jgi:hypothetical protein
MKDIYIRNIFVDIFLTWYFKYAYQISFAALTKSVKTNFSDERTLSTIFGSINSKIRSVNMHNSKNCSFLNLSGILNLPIKEIYPVKFNLKTDEQFWFEFIVNMPAEQIFQLCEDSKNIREIRRLYSIPDSYKEEFLSIFNNPQAIDLIRTRFIRGEKIGNEPQRTGFFIDYKTGIAHRVNY